MKYSNYMRHDVSVPELYKDSHPSSAFWAEMNHYRDTTGHSPKITTMGGPVGTGKTHDACGFLNVAEANKYSTGYTRASDYWKYDEEELYCIESIIKILVIDDYGKRTSPGNLERISDIVDARINAGKKYTLITTNVLNELRELDERLASRVNMGVIIDYTGLPDRRINA